MIIGITTTLNEVDGFQRVNVEYIARVADAGAIPVLIPPIEGGFEKNAEQARGIIDHLDGIILSGGGDVHPRHYVKVDDESVWDLVDADPHPSSAGGGFCADSFAHMRDIEQAFGLEPTSPAPTPENAAGRDAFSDTAGPAAAHDTIQLDGRTTEESGAIVPFCLDGLLAVSDNRDGLELTLARLAHERGIPTLGICRGLQIMNVALGGSLHRDLLAGGITDKGHRQDPPFDVTHDSVEIKPESTLAAIFGTHGDFAINSMHHQGVNEVSDELEIAAVSPDGLVEGLEDPNHPFFVGVQWHPEYLDEQSALFEAFIDAVRNAAA